MNRTPKTWNKLRDGIKEPDTCPFCGEADFDAIGLKAHFTYGHCDIMEQLETLSEERQRKSTAKTGEMK